MTTQRVLVATVGLLALAIFAAACGGEAEPAPTPTPLAVMPAPESFGAAPAEARGAVPAPEGVQIIPRTTEFPEPASEGPPSDYSVVGPDYDSVHDPILGWGREFAALIADGDATAARERFHRTLRGQMTEDRILGRIAELTTNRVRFEANALGSTFDGHVSDETIAGGYVADTVTASFGLEAVELTGPGPIEGRWAGAISLGQDQTLAIEIIFESDGDEITGTLAFPDQRQDGIPLTDIVFEESRPIGDMMVDLAVQGLYGADHAWGGHVLSVWVTFDSLGSVIGLDTAPRRQLREHPTADYQSPTTWRLPVDGIWWVNYGGPTYLQNRHARIPARRYAYDLAVWKDGSFARGSGSTNEDFYAFSQPVLAPAAGTVVAVLDGIEDNRPGQANALAHPAGNHVVVRTPANEYLVLAHLQQGSIRVQQGDEVGTGDLLALVGNSGLSGVPHLHFFVQDQPDIASPIALGLPVSYSNYYADGELVAIGVPVQGQLVQHAGQ